MIDPEVEQHVQKAMDEREYKNQYRPSPIPSHIHNGTDSQRVAISDTDGTLAITKGGTGQITANAALNALLPSQTANSGKFLTSNGTDSSWGAVSLKFGGTGADGALTKSSGTTTIDLGGLAVCIKNYSSISITGTGQITFTNPNASGTLVIILCSGACVMTSSNPAFLLRGVGGAGGAGNNGGNFGTTVTAAAGSENNDYGHTPISTGKNGGGSSGSTADQSWGGGGASLFTAGTAGTVGTLGSGTQGVAGTAISGLPLFFYLNQIYLKNTLLISGAGGGGGLSTTGVNTTIGTGANGAGGSITTPSGTSGSAITNNGVVYAIGGSGGGGSGGGGFYMEVAGSLNFTGSIDASGGNGGNGGNANNSGNKAISGSGGGAGSGGTIIVLYNSQTAISGAFNVNGGSGGSAGTATGSGAPTSFNGGNGGNGGNGYSVISQNYWFA